MTGPHRIAQVYGYAACLAALITVLVCLGNIVTAAFDLRDPLHAQGYFEQQRALSSVENYRMDVLRSLKEGQPAPDDASVQAMFDAARDAQISSVRLQATRAIAASGLVLLVACGIFAGHWIWLARGTPGPPAASATPAIAA